MKEPSSLPREPAPGAPSALDAAGAPAARGDVATLAAAWQTETDPATKLALLRAFTDLLCDTVDDAAVAALLNDTACTDAIRADVAARARSDERRRIAIATLQRPVPQIVPNTGLARTSVYIPRILQQHLASNSTARSWTADGTAAFVDISGFTMLSEKLARKGREGAEQIADAIGKSFEAILDVSYDNGGSLLKFGGDALLLWFASADHATRASRAAVLMRRALRQAGRIRLPDARVTLRIAQGLHSGSFNFFAVGASHVELLPVGPAWSRLVETQKDAGADRILVSADMAARLPSRCLGEASGRGRELRREPSNHRESLPRVPRPSLSDAILARTLPPAIRDHVSAGGTSEHRPVTVAFIRFEGTDALIERAGPAAAEAALDRLLAIVQGAVEPRRVSFLASDVDADGGKLILAAGAPTVSGDDEERMLLALREIAAADLPLPVRIGVHRGSVFAGDIGPFYRRTYTVMGDAVNLTARLMARAQPGEIYATADVLDRSNTLFSTRALEPFTVKGKSRAVQAWAVGPATGSRSRNASLQDAPPLGRDREIGLLRAAVESARAGTGALIELVGEAGIGKTRLMEVLRAQAAEMRQLHGVCEAYTASTPYGIWRELLREFMGFGRDAADNVVVAGLQDFVAAQAPELVAWLPLIGITFGVDMPSTPEVDMLAERNRRSKLHEVVGAFLASAWRAPTLIEIESAQHMDAASGELLAALLADVAKRPWLVAITRRPSAGGFSAPGSSAVTQLTLEPLAIEHVLRVAELATHEHPLPMHVLKTIAQRSGGNPQYLRDLLRAAMASGGVGGLPDSAEAAAIARIDALTPQDRAIVRRAAVFGVTFHPRNLAWLSEDDEYAEPGASVWERLGELFDEEGDGYLRFRRSLLRDAAYEGLPFKLRRRLHSAVAARLEQELDDPDDASGILSLHCFVAGEYERAWRYAKTGARRAAEIYGYVEAAALYARALESAERLAGISHSELAAVHESLGDAWNHAGEFRKAAIAYADARKCIGSDPLWQSRLLLKHSKIEEKLGKCSKALRWAARARNVLGEVTGREVSRHAADLDAWYATVLQTEGRPKVALRWAQRAVDEAERIDDAEALGAAYFVLGWVRMDLGQGGAEPMWKRSLEAYRRAGNRERQAGLLANLGAACQWDGRWDDALAYYELGRQQSLAIGDLVDSELARINVAEILADRGEWEQAETTLVESLPRWRALEYRYFLAACLSVLGRVALRSGRYDDALARLDEARGLFEHAGAAQEVLDIDARIAECHCLRGEADAALALADATLARAKNGGGVPKVASLLERVRGFVFAQRGEVQAAARSFAASLAAARARRDYFEIALAAMAQITLDRTQGREAPAELVVEFDALVERLKVVTLSPMPPLCAAS